MTYALRCAARLTGGGRKKISREGLSLCHAQVNGSGPRKRIMGETFIIGYYSRAIMDKARAVRAKTKNSLEMLYPVAKSN
jgi:hypothetical protein